jgi:hypothetical protein
MGFAALTGPTKIDLQNVAHFSRLFLRELFHHTFTTILHPITRRNTAFCAPRFPKPIEKREITTPEKIARQ